MTLSAPAIDDIPKYVTLTSLPHDVILCGLIFECPFEGAARSCCPLLEARKLPSAQRYRWMQSLSAERKSEIVAQCHDCFARGR